MQAGQSRSFVSLPGDALVDLEAPFYVEWLTTENERSEKLCLAVAILDMLVENRLRGCQDAGLQRRFSGHPGCVPRQTFSGFESMAPPRVCILRAPGTNCDHETAHAFELCGGTATRVHLFELLESPHLLRDYQVLCVPGGFSYGDDIGAGVVFGSQLQGQLAETIGEFLHRDTLTLGICNGFQVLMKAGVLPGGGTTWPPKIDQPPPATLTWNENGKYTALWVKLRGQSSKNVFLRGIDEIELPIAHAEGRIAVRDRATLDQWVSGGQVGLCYSDAHGHVPTSGELLPYPANPNGSIANIAGLGDPTGRVLGLMPHPERFLFATQHPRWTRLGLKGEGDGLKLFKNAMDYFRAA